MAIDTATRARLAQEFIQDQFAPGFVENYRILDKTGLMHDMINSGAESVNLEGNRYTWNLRNRVTMTPGYANNTTYSAQTLESSGEDNKNLKITRDVIYCRGEISGQELRESDTFKFFSTVAQKEADGRDVLSHTLSALVLRTGTGKLTTVTTAGAADTAAGASVAIPVADTQVFIEGGVYDLVNSDDSTVAATTLRCDSKSTNVGPGNVTFTNLSGSTTGSITSGQGLWVANSSSAGLGMGLGYSIDDGATYSKYPREISGSGNVALTRTSYPRALKAIVITKSSQKINWGIFDDINQRLSEEGDEESIQYSMDNPMIQHAYRCIMRPAHFQELAALNRAAGRAYTLGEKVEDFGLRRPVYGSIVFTQHNLMPIDTLYVYNTKDAKFHVGGLEVISGGSGYGPFERAHGYDKYELMFAQEWQHFFTKLTNQVKVTGVTGRTVGS